MYLRFFILLATVSICSCHPGFKAKTSPDGDRCGMCPTYFDKICAINSADHTTMIFDNHCIMDVYNCLEGTVFEPVTYDNCLFASNFAYVHGKKDEDYGEDSWFIHDSKKNHWP